MTLLTAVGGLYLSLFCGMLVGIVKHMGGGD